MQLAAKVLEVEPVVRITTSTSASYPGGRQQNRVDVKAGDHSSIMQGVCHLYPKFVRTSVQFFVATLNINLGGIFDRR